MPMLTDWDIAFAHLAPLGDVCKKLHVDNSGFQSENSSGFHIRGKALGKPNFSRQIYTGGQQLLCHVHT